MPKSPFIVYVAFVSVIFGSNIVLAQDSSVLVSSDIEFMPQFYSNETVTNAPVTATITTRSVQQLYDGNRIVHEDVTRLYRDSRGRVRRELSPGGASNRSMISLSDPVEQSTFMLDAVNKIAFKVPEIGDLISNGKASFEAVRLDDSGNVSESRSVDVLIAETSLDGQAPRSDQPALTAASLDSLHSPIDSLIAAPQAIDNIIVGKRAIDELTMLIPSSPNGSSSDQTDVQSLGQKTIGGIRLEGTSYTTTYPPNTFGNEKSIVVHKTTWFAPDLQMMVSTEEQDPRFGTIVYEAEIVSTDEPDASLFDIPPDYEVIEPGRHAE